MKFKIGLPASLVVSVLLAVSYVPAVSAVDIQRLVPFQGRLHGADSQAVSDGHYDLTFYIYDTPTGGTALWTETHANVSVIHGYINVLLGATELMDEPTYANGDPQYDASKSTVDFTSQKYLGVSIDGGAEMFPRSQLVPSFHAFTANHAEHATQADNAATADHATQADNATTADHATQADNASNADNADTLGDEPPSTYATASSLQTLDERVTSGFDDLGAGAGGLADRTTDLEAKFTGDKAKNADQLDDKDASGFIQSNFANGYYGMSDSAGSTSQWIRTTVNGLIPFNSTSAGSGFLGTSSWPFQGIYGINIYDEGELLESKYLEVDSNLSEVNETDARNNLGLDQAVVANVTGTYSRADIGTLRIYFGRVNITAQTNKTVTVSDCFSSVNSFSVVATSSVSGNGEIQAVSTTRGSQCSWTIYNHNGGTYNIEWIAMGQAN